jgi:hypothetical protein
MVLSKETFIALAAIAWADGFVAYDEARAICHAAASCGIIGPDFDDIERATRQRQAIWMIDATKLSHEQRMFCFAMATWIAYVDGRVVAEETAMIEALGDALALEPRERLIATAAAAELGAQDPDSRPSRYDIVELARRLEEPLSARAA